MPSDLLDIFFWRHHPDLNWGWGFCRPLPYLLAMMPYRHFWVMPISDNLVERETGFGPATFTLARWHSTTESLPQATITIPNKLPKCNSFAIEKSKKSRLFPKCRILGAIECANCALHIGKLCYNSEDLCGCGGIGRHARFRFLCESVQVQVLSSAP